MLVDPAQDSRWPTHYTGVAAFAQISSWGSRFSGNLQYLHLGEDRARGSAAESFTLRWKRLNLWLRMPIDQYVVDFRRSVYRADPLMPILGNISALGAVVFALHSSGRTVTLAWLGIALIAVIIVIIFGEPINSRFPRLPKGEQPDAAEQLRIRWRRFHLARTGIALLLLACLAAAAVYRC
jgi:hypothetical protein